MAKRSFRNKNRKGERKTFGTRDDPNNTTWKEIVRDNANWEAYYRSQNIIPDEEWETFKEHCRAQLPLTFRVTGSRKHATEVKRLFIEKHLPNLSHVEFEGATLQPPKSLPWYPEELAWQLDVSKGALRKNEQFAKTQRYLVLETEVGNISRQEAVSMIPPIVLEVEPHHTVLDMCAAPGSKTAQLIEALHAKGDEPTGFVVANDADAKRSHMLVHQVKRLNSPNLMVVNHDAQLFPKVKDGNSFLKFDRILADVPCAGDGTMRKNVNVWKDWGVGAGNGLHPVQLNILNRGLNLLKEGGRLVYSTCSMNPIENEAVVAAALRKWGDKVKLVDCSDKLPGLVRSPGISTWKVYGKDFEVKEKGDESVAETFFPPTTEEAEAFHLDRCMRVYPHQQNTGGFFIVAFEKIAKNAEAPAEAETEETPAPVAAPVETEAEVVVKKQKTETEAIPTKKEKLPRDANEEPFFFLSPEHPQLAKCWKFYGFDEKFDKTTCLVRNATGDPTRIIYYTSPSLKPILEANETRLKIVHAGIKAFVSQRSDIECMWRVQSEALPTFKHYLGQERIIEANRPLFEKLLKEAFPRFEELEALKIDDTFLQKVSNLSTGCSFISVARGDNEEDLFLPIWNGNKCVNLMVSKQETFELLYRVCGVETTNKDEYKQKPTGPGKPIVGINESTPETEEATPETEEATPEVEA